MDSAKSSARSLTLLSNLLLGTERSKTPEKITQAVANYGREDMQLLCELASSHHVLMRAFPDLHRVMAAEGDGRAEWLENAMTAERERIQRALSFLSPICEALEDAGEVIVIKSLDHWPDLGSDVDIYTTADGADVVAIMRERFKADVPGRSWGDRLAHKWNFIVPGLLDLVEVHAGRLGQTGEQVAIADCLVARASAAQFGCHIFRVPKAEDRVIISTLQRMYRHFYLRLCDVVNIARLVDSVALDYDYLESLARSSGIWDGLATYLVILSQYLELYRGVGLALPHSVTGAARFGGGSVSFSRNFLRIPIFPHAARLYAREWAQLLLNGELPNMLRLSLLPGLAAAAVLAFRITGSDKGIW
jgi:hypothetical protein